LTKRKKVAPREKKKRTFPKETARISRKDRWPSFGEREEGNHSSIIVKKEEEGSNP